MGANFPLPPKPASFRAPRAPFRWRFLSLPALVLVSISGGFWLSRRGRPQAPLPASSIETKARVTAVRRMPFQDVLPLMGTFKGGAEIELRAEKEGKISVFPFEAGDTVERGAVVAALAHEEDDIKLEKAELDLIKAEKRFSLGDLETSVVREARLAVRQAELSLKKALITAPIRGILGDKDANVGEFVSPGKRVAVLYGIESVVLQMGVTEKDVDKIVPGQIVTATVDSYKDVVFSGKITRIEPGLDAHSRTLTVLARFDNEGTLLLPGMFARAGVRVFEDPDALAVPNEAVERTGNGPSVWVLSEGKKAIRRPVRIGYASPSFSVVTEGLEEGEKILLYRPAELREGDVVQPVEE